MILVHADWSVADKKRWLALARQDAERWTIDAVRHVGLTDALVSMLLNLAGRTTVIAGFDFPIGAPAAYGARTGLADFPALLQSIGEGAFTDFAKVAREPKEISRGRPFYPAGASAGLKQQDLLDAHGVRSLDELRRACERATADRRAACPLFWTLGGNQVGRAALSGWIEVLRPAIEAGAVLWPFHGSLPELERRGRGLILAETYPAEAYGHVGVVFRASESKRRQSDRAAKAPAICDWARRSSISLDPQVADLIEDGFGADAQGEDRFDALMGLLGMIEVATGKREAAPALPVDALAWEGWIFGQRAPALASSPGVQEAAMPTGAPARHAGLNHRQSPGNGIFAHDLMAAVGEVMLYWGYLERAMFEAIGGGARLGILQRWLAAAGPPLETVAELEEAASVRHLLAHGLYEIQAQPHAGGEAEVICLTPEATPVRLTIGRLREVANTFDRIRLSIEADARTSPAS